MAQMIGTRRPAIYVDQLLDGRSIDGKNPCAISCLKVVKQTSRTSLIRGLRKILPFMYSPYEEAHDIFDRYGIDAAEGWAFPSGKSFQFSHIGEILVCVYMEEVEKHVVPVYKWRLNTSGNQNPFGMDIISFDLTKQPPEIGLVAVKATAEGKDGSTPSNIYAAIRELDDYLARNGYDDDLAILFLHLDVTEDEKKVLADWYDPYSQQVPSARPTLVAVPAYVVEEQYWQDKFAAPPKDHAFSVPGRVNVICVEDLTGLVAQVFEGIT